MRALKPILDGLGQEIEVLFSLPGLEQPCEAVCRVQWLREANPATPDILPGAGCRFIRLAAQDMAVIQRFVEARDPLFYDED